ncbi:shikimate dehydrogenase [Chelatococcus albus]
MTLQLRKACIIGYPVKHSRSPLLHGHWLHEYGLDGAYERAEVAPEDLASFMAGFAGKGYVGGNVTVPHKESIMACLDAVTETAQAMGAVNTLWFEGGRLCGDNTDVVGFLANLDEGAPGWDARTRTVVVLGAGGAAKAVVYGLLQRGMERVAVVNRSFERADALRERFGSRVLAAPWEALPALLGETKLLVNTTSLGMSGQPPLAIDLEPLPSGAVVNDIVYVPLETPLLTAARARGLLAVDGLGMLLHQAVPGFERWFGVRPQVSAALRAHIVADIVRTNP